MKFTIFLIFLGALFFADAEVKCGTKGKGNTRIVGGRKARKGAWPWQVTMKYKKKSDLNYCGGSIIARDWIVTAAHCFQKSQNPQDYTITVGEHNLKDKDGDEQKIPIEKIICHPSYNEYKHHKFDYDIALLKLKSNITFNEMVRPICLPTTSFSPGTNCYVTGWGYLLETEPGPSVLRQAIVPLISYKDCQKAFGDQEHPISPRMLCAGKYKGGANDACEGDSGGPLVCMAKSGIWELVGVVSWGVGCASRDRYGVYTNMKELKGWIKSTVNS